MVGSSGEELSSSRIEKAIFNPQKSEDHLLRQPKDFRALLIQEKGLWEHLLVVTHKLWFLWDPRAQLCPILVNCN